MSDMSNRYVPLNETDKPIQGLNIREFTEVELGGRTLRVYGGEPRGRHEQLDGWEATQRSTNEYRDGWIIVKEPVITEPDFPPRKVLVEEKYLPIVQVGSMRPAATARMMTTLGRYAADAVAAVAAAESVAAAHEAEVTKRHNGTQ